MKKLITICAVVTMVLTVSGVASAAVSTFETFNTGVSVNGQSGWTVEDQWGYDMSEGGWGPNLDEQIVDDGTGNKVWRISNAYAYNAYSSQPFSPTAGSVAGETGSSLWNDRGPDHTNPYSPPHYGANATTNLFHSSFDFRSATDELQSGLKVDISASAKQSTVRQTLLRIQDNGVSGLDLRFNDDFGWHDNFVASLAYGGWHNVTMDIQFVNGVVDIDGDPYTLHPGDPGFNANDVYGNDLVRIYVDGQLKLTATTWEGYYYAYNDAHPAPTIQAVDSLLFRVAGTAAPATLGQGFFFDNIDVSNVPEPATICLLGLGALSLLKKRRA